MNEEKNVLAVIDRVYAAWEAGDATAFVADYLDDASSIMPGAYRANADEVREAMAASFAGPLKGSRVLGGAVATRFQAPDTAVVVARNAIAFAGEEQVPDDRWIMATWTLVRDGDTWKIAAYHNCAA